MVLYRCLKEKNKTDLILNKKKKENVLSEKFIPSFK